MIGQAFFTPFLEQLTTFGNAADKNLPEISPHRTTLY